MSQTSPPIPRLRQQGTARQLIVEVHTNGWPEDESTLDDADTIVLFGDGGSRHTEHPLLRDGHMPVLAKQMKRGCGLVVIHWSLNMPSNIGRETFFRWIGGFKDYEDPPRPLGQPLRVDDWSKQANHPICRGLKPFTMPDDEYKTPERLLSDEPGFVPILPFPGKPGDPLWAWAWPSFPWWWQPGWPGSSFAEPRGSIRNTGGWQGAASTGRGGTTWPSWG